MTKKELFLLTSQRSHFQTWCSLPPKSDLWSSPITYSLMWALVCAGLPRSFIIINKLYWYYISQMFIEDTVTAFCCPVWTQRGSAKTWTLCEGHIAMETRMEWKLQFKCSTVICLWWEWFSVRRLYTYSHYVAKDFNPGTGIPPLELYVKCTVNWIVNCIFADNA